mmetsp:Transcript_68585/g.125075  ORF Transcript_68585/g.125075 Transcript_68585/m.125075 type:complete len:146 (-) Transcript_68585:111-548(-)
MVRPVKYSPTTKYSNSEEAKTKYKAIAAAIKEKTADPAAAVTKVDEVLAQVAKMAAEEWDPVPDPNLDSGAAEWDDFVDSADPEYVGILLDGVAGAVKTDGDLEIDTEDVEEEEPNEVKEEEEEEEDERSLWGDGEKEPGEAEDE